MHVTAQFFFNGSCRFRSSCLKIKHCNDWAGSQAPTAYVNMHYFMSISLQLYQQQWLRKKPHYFSCQAAVILKSWKTVDIGYIWSYMRPGGKECDSWLEMSAREQGRGNGHFVSADFFFYPIFRLMIFSSQQCFPITIWKKNTSSYHTPEWATTSSLFHQTLL